MNVHYFIKGILAQNAEGKRMLLGVCVGVGFSISIILATIGIMSGFELALKRGLHAAEGDIFIFSRMGFFSFEDRLRSELNEYGVKDISPRIDSEGFVVRGEEAFGVLLRGVDNSFLKVSSLSSVPNDNEIILGKTLQEKLGVAIGDSVTVLLSGSKDQSASAPTGVTLTVKGTVDHGIHERDLRTAYVSRNFLAEKLDVGKEVNVISLQISSSLSFSKDPLSYTQQVQKQSDELRDILGPRYVVRPFWGEYQYLIKAVEAEKALIILVLQLVVVVSIFNVVAFVIFINEKKAKEIFLLRALGMDFKRIKRTWYGVAIGMMAIACLIAKFLVFTYSLAMEKLPFLQLPPEVYHLGKLSIEISNMQYLLVFTLTFFWVWLMLEFTLRRISKRSLLAGLRQEFG